jgi:hypothetical protein
MTTLQRAGGLKLDPAVAQWQKKAMTNMGAQTRKQRSDRVRVRVKYDLAPELKGCIEAEAKRVHTSASQMAAFLLAYAVHHLGDEELATALQGGTSPSSTMKFEFNLEAPEEWGKRDSSLRSE